MVTREVVLRRICALVLVTPASLLFTAPGCGFFDWADDCQRAATCFPGTSTTSTTSTSGQLHCDPTAGAVDEGCGVFVSSSQGDDGNDGTQRAPLRSLAAALTKAGAGRVYACGEIFTEAVRMTAGTTLYGALDCANGWAYDAQRKTVITAAAGVIPLILASTVVGGQVLDVKIAAADATAVGGSSIAVVVDHATASFTRCDLVAGNGSDGAPGTSGGTQEVQAEGGMKGDDAGLTGTSKGGSGGTNTSCNLLGGNGGNGGTTTTTDGVDGLPGDNGSGGTKGTGQTSAAACANGGNGDPGAAGPPGPVTLGIGAIDATGWHGIDGNAGSDGTDGASGGGGGGSQAVGTAHGAGGGGGGAGGCAGKHGTGGTAAGSSIALVSLSASLSLVRCTLGASQGGRGGAGGDGQFGQQGGASGPGGNSGGGAGKACNGGTGGDGGNGGNGSGGSGGHSLALAVMGMPPARDEATTAALTFGIKGGGGQGGHLDVDLNHGADGIAATCWSFTANAACN